MSAAGWLRASLLAGLGVGAGALLYTAHTAHRDLVRSHASLAAELEQLRAQQSGPAVERDGREGVSEEGVGEHAGAARARPDAGAPSVVAAVGRAALLERLRETVPVGWLDRAKVGTWPDRGRRERSEEAFPIGDALRARDAGSRIEAVEALGELRDPARLTELADLLDDPSPRVREAVARALEEMPAADADALLLDLLGDGDGEVVEGAVRALGRRGTLEAVPEIAPLLERDDADLLEEVGVALRRLGAHEAADRALERVALQLASDAPRERQRALRGIRRIGGVGARPHLEQGLLDASPRVRREAERSLELLGGALE